jgi:hypothetical protein
MVANADDYHSGKNHFSVKFDSDWKKTESPETTIELALVPNSATCSTVAFISFGAYYDSRMKDVSTDVFMKVANGKAITGQIKATPFIRDFSLIREGRTKLGDSDAYEVLMKYTHTGGPRFRHSFITFNKGFFYNISFHSTPESYESDFKVAKKIFATFRFTD